MSSVVFQTSFIFSIVFQSVSVTPGMVILVICRDYTLSIKTISEELLKKQVIIVLFYGKNCGCSTEVNTDNKPSQWARNTTELESVDSSIFKVPIIT